MKKLFYLLFLLPLFGNAQNDKKVITHTVGPKENITSIGRLYNINGRELANFNKIDYEKGLTLGQVLKIPAVNTSTEVAITTPVKQITPVNAVVASVVNGTPIYHTVTKKETLYHISTLYNKVPIADIRKWNNLTSDALSEGANIIVGYSSTKTDSEVKIVPVTKLPIEKQVVQNVVIKPKKEEIPIIKTPVENEVNVQTKKSEIDATTVNNIKATDFKGGFFKNLFDEQNKNKQVFTETGIGGVFKSTSGWEDGRYYCLHNTAAAGTILKITNNANGKIVYAKVLDLIPDIKQNNGLFIRISNAAADVLGVAENKLDCTLNYSK